MRDCDRCKTETPTKIYVRPDIGLCDRCYVQVMRVPMGPVISEGLAKEEVVLSNNNLPITEEL